MRGRGEVWGEREESSSNLIERRGKGGGCGRGGKRVLCGNAYTKREINEMWEGSMRQKRDGKDYLVCVPVVILCIWFFLV